ncbi:MAG: DNA (cytosine-5-)-methyltransferase [Deltaproteobacteria bacterium]|nr:DNA (cytosine-5-)-methyltransferase [Deltaproteobacteria bacterium]
MATRDSRYRGKEIRKAGNSPLLVCVDLFCGLGGLTHGLIKGGVHVAAGIDIDTQCRFPYQENNDATFIEADVRNLTSKELRAFWKEGTHSLLAGCAPCQPFSTYSRKGRGSRKDTKWELVADFGRLVREARPDFVTMENVPQLVDHPVFAAFLDTLSDYQIWWDVINCAQYGVPQTRKRLVLLASRLGPISLLPPVVDKNENPATVRHAIAHLPPIAAGESDPNDTLHSACSLSELNLRRIRASRPGGTWRDWDEALIANCHRKDAGQTYPSVYGRMEWDAPAPTITTQSFGYGNGRFGHPEQDRAISLREAAILQTFPETYRFLQEGEPVRTYVLGRLIGNAVPVRIGEIVARSFLKHIARFPK